MTHIIFAILEKQVKACEKQSVTQVKSVTPLRRQKIIIFIIIIYYI